MNANKGKPLAYREPKRPVHPIAHALRKRRYDLGLSAEVVANQAGYSLKTLQDWECGAHVPKFRSLQDWANALGMRLDVVEAK